MNEGEKMSRIVILGAGISGHTAARYLNKWLGKKHEIIVVSPNAKWNWIPSNIWVGVGQMTEKDVTFDLPELYAKTNMDFRQAKALAIHPEGNADNAQPFVTVEYTRADKAGVQENISYDYLINATGPKLNFGATEGLVTLFPFAPSAMRWKPTTSCRPALTPCAQANCKPS
jgi:sulfide:quinone oxidoreductase